MHKSYESGILEDATRRPDPDMFTVSRSPKDAPDEPLELSITFKDAMPVRVENHADGRVEEDPLHLFVLPQRARQPPRHRPGRHGREPVRRHQVARGLRDARRHHPAPGAARPRGDRHGPRGAAPARQPGASLRRADLQRLLVQPGDGLPAGGASARPRASSTAPFVLELYKGNVTICGRESPTSLYDKELSSMDVEGGYDADAR